MKTNVSESSIATYHELKESGVLDRRSQEICEVLSKTANISCRSITQEINNNRGYESTFPSSVAGRLNELVEKKYVEKSASLSKCQITRRMVNKYCLAQSLSSNAA